MHVEQRKEEERKSKGRFAVLVKLNLGGDLHAMPRE